MILQYVSVNLLTLKEYRYSISWGRTLKFYIFDILSIYYLMNYIYLQPYAKLESW
jgi:hypothetical protein